MPNNNPAKLAKLRMPDYSGSWWNMRFSDTTTMRIGKWTPQFVRDIPGRSLLKVRPHFRFESLPLISPLYGGFTMRTKYYFAPYRLYIPELRKNLQQSWDSVPKLKLPRMCFQSAPYRDGNFTVSGISLAGSLLDRLNMCYGEIDNFAGLNNPYYFRFTTAGVESATSTTLIKGYTNMLPLLAYIDAWLYGEYNPQDKNIPVDVDTISALSGDDVNTFNRTYGRSFISYDNLCKLIPAVAYGTSFSMQVGVTSLGNSGSYSASSSLYTIGRSSPAYSPYLNLVADYPLFSYVKWDNSQNDYSTVSKRAGFFSKHWKSFQNMTSAVGLLPVTYKGDYFKSWFNEDAIAQAQTFVVSSGATILSLRKTNDDMFISLLSSISGNRWVDYLQYVFETDLELKDHPILVGFDEMDFGSIDVLSQSDTTGGEEKPIGANSVLGGSSSKVRNYSAGVKPFSVKTKEPGLLLVCSAIVPNVVYYQGTPRFMSKSILADLWHPQYQKQGFQETLRGELFNPFAMANPEITITGFNQDESLTNQMAYTAPVSINSTFACWEPLGYEYMSTYDTISGGFKTPAFRTWSLRENVIDAGVVSLDSPSYPPTAPQSFVVENLDMLRSSNVEEIFSTYVDGGKYNYMFSNISRGDGDNFIVKHTLDVSIYQPIAHTLVSKTI